MYLKYNQEELRSICRNHLESFENWARIIIDLELTKQIGENYLTHTKDDGNYFLKKDLVLKAQRMMADEPSRFPKSVDTFFLEEIIYILCRPDLFSNYFSTFLNEMYPEGVNELRTFLNRLIPIRNKLSHSNPFSVREAEQCVCYCNDFIVSVKQYFINHNMSKQFNIPTIIKVNDSLGNEYKIIEGRAGERLDLVDPETKSKKVFTYGEEFVLWLTMDPSFDEDQYTLNWTQKSGVEISDSGKRVDIKIGDELVGDEIVLFCRVVSDKNWHKYLNYDQQLIVHFKSLPPI